MASPLDNINIDKSIANLKHRLETALGSETKAFSQIGIHDKRGLYFIFDNNNLLYIGMTMRKGKKRLREVITSYEKHTLNRKLLAEHLRSEGIYKNDSEDTVHVLTKTIADNLIANNRLTNEQFKNYQKQVNDRIKTYKYKFWDCELVDLPWIEHFAIAVLAPFYND